MSRPPSINATGLPEAGRVLQDRDRPFIPEARERIRIDCGGYRRDHLRALAQRVEVADKEVPIMGSKSNLLQTLTAASSVKPATPGVRSSVLKWRMGWDSNPRTLAGWRFSRPLP
jgi:site-specific DNA recombinase